MLHGISRELIKCEETEEGHDETKEVGRQLESRWSNREREEQDE